MVGQTSLVCDIVLTNFSDVLRISCDRACASCDLENICCRAYLCQIRISIERSKEFDVKSTAIDATIAINKLSADIAPSLLNT